MADSHASEAGANTQLSRFLKCEPERQVKEPALRTGERVVETFEVP